MADFVPNGTLDLLVGCHAKSLHPMPLGIARPDDLYVEFSGS
jgi:hypothetical protein